MLPRFAARSMLRVFSWEFLQNLPVLAGFAGSDALWSMGRAALAIACLCAAGVTGAVVIALTERWKVPGHVEKRAVLLANALGISALLGGMLAYFQSGWSSWLTDVPAGILSGAGLGIAQSVAAKERIGVRHCAALGSAAVLGLSAARFLLRGSVPPWLGVLLLTLLVTLIICGLDYSSRAIPNTGREPC